MVTTGVKASVRSRCPGSSAQKSEVPRDPSDLEDDPDQGLEGKGASIASLGEDHRSRPEVEGQCRGSAEEILDATTEEDGHGQGAELAERDEQRKIESESDVQIVPYRYSESQTDRKRHPELRPAA